MDNSLQTALKNLIENQATADEINLLREAYVNGNISIDGNIQNSVILIGNHNQVFQMNTRAFDRLISELNRVSNLPTDDMPATQQFNQPTIALKKTRSLIRLNQYVETVKNLVKKSKYKEAVITAQQIRSEISVISDSNSPEIKLVVGELDVWYAHALMYTGESTKSLETLHLLDESLKALRQQYNDEDFVRWCLILGRTHNHIGYINWVDLGHYEMALSEFRKALAYFVDGKLEEELATDYDNIGRVYAQIGYPTRAKLLIEHGKQLRQKQSDRYRLALSLNSHAMAYLNFGQPNQALNINDEALALFEMQVPEQGLRGKGLALITKAHALRQIGSSQQRTDERATTFFDEAIQILTEAESIFQEVSEDIRRFQVFNELGCAYRDKAFILKQSQDTDSALRQAGIAIDYLKESIEIAKGNGKEYKYLAHYVDTCEDLAQVYSITGNQRESNKWLEYANGAIPEIYKFRRGMQPETIAPNICFEDFWQQMGKMSLLQGHIALRNLSMEGKRSEQLKKAFEQYILASAYFGRFSERPVGSEYKHLYPIYRPQLASHRKFIEQLYSSLNNISWDELNHIYYDLLPELKNDYNIKNIWTEDLLDEPLSLAMQMGASNF